MASRLTIDELARAAGITTRNVRAYQERGLLPPPAKVGRTGYYDDGHVARLKVIAELLDKGYSLAAIHDLLSVWERGGDVAQVLGLEQALVRPFTDERPTTVTLEQLAERFPGIADSEIVRRVLELGIVQIEGVDGPGSGLPAPQVVVPSMRVLEAGAELVRSGIPFTAVLDQAEALQQDTARIAERFVGLVVEHVFEPLLAGGAPDDVSKITELIERLRPLAAQTVFPMLAQALEREVQAAAANVIGSVPAPDADAAAS
jgi:DNA-binding transcriptional MerR regulator